MLSLSLNLRLKLSFKMCLVLVYVILDVVFYVVLKVVLKVSLKLSLKMSWTMFLTLFICCPWWLCSCVLLNYCYSENNLISLLVGGLGGGIKWFLHQIKLPFRLVWMSWCCDRVKKSNQILDVKCYVILSKI